MPAIGPPIAFLFAILAFFGGWILGVQQPLLIQAAVAIAGFALLTSWAVRGLEIGAIAYYLIYLCLCVGIVVGDISYLWQTGGDIANPVAKLLDLFTIK